MWNKKVKVIPVIIGALGTTPKALPKILKEIEIATRIVELQRLCCYNLLEFSDKCLSFEETCCYQSSRTSIH